MPIEAYFDIKRKVGANFDKEHPELFVQNIEIVMCHKNTPTTIIKPDFRPMIFPTSSIAAGFLLRFANQYHSATLVKFRQMSACCVILCFSMFKIDDCQTLLLGKLLYCSTICFPQRRQQ